ncbi:MAG: protein-L-isoaspartate(D-aspartate) O-methyltransferase [Ignavibacteriae bacterium]|nr:protein-L-isoaspartate(D-aspartate) O-methyltransferase [Ignavibacteriota bacterium]MCB9211289.1 protein-L-isoaspartate(D-aspartate) O-methyltransferase [Ignavibacteriales bacterium]
MGKMYETERNHLVDELKKKGIKDEKVLAAILAVPRHEFVQKIMIPHAYKDVALPIGYGQTISQPFTVATMTEALKLNPNDKVLEIGTGSGYQAAVLRQIGVQVFSIERNEDIYRSVQKLFDEKGLRVHCRCSDGTIGWSEFAPYNGIIVTAGSPTVPENLKKQLAVGGRLVIPVGDKKTQSLKILQKIDDENFNVEEIPNFAFVPLIGREGWS